jgi:hypothetical protein
VQRGTCQVSTIDTLLLAFRPPQVEDRHHHEIHRREEKRKGQGEDERVRVGFRMPEPVEYFLEQRFRIRNQVPAVEPQKPPAATREAMVKIQLAIQPKDRRANDCIRINETIPR